MAASLSTLGYYCGGSPAHPMLITAFFFNFWSEGQLEVHNEVWSLSPYERMVGFEWATFRSDQNTWNDWGTLTHSAPWFLVY